MIVTANPDRRQQARRLHTQAEVVETTAQLFARAAELDLVVIASPPASHVPLAHEALDHGLAVVVDKPLCVAAEQGAALVERAQSLGHPLTVFQNRRWDADFRTVRALLERGELGDVWRFESRFEWWKPQEPKQWKAQADIASGGGILYDLGTHLIDQTVQLFGPVDEVRAELATRRAGGGAEDEAFLSLLHRSGARSHLHMSAVAAAPGPRFHLLGSQAAYTKWGLDGQEAALKAGMSPADPEYGVEPESAWGTLGVNGDDRAVPMERGDYGAFYAQLATSLRDGGPVPVDPLHAVRTIELIESIHKASGSRS
jgi:predicted dehydrogenase